VVAQVGDMGRVIVDIGFRDVVSILYIRELVMSTQYIVEYFPTGGEHQKDYLGEYEDLDTAKEAAQKSGMPYTLNWSEVFPKTWHASRGNYGAAYYTIKLRPHAK